MWGVGPSTPAAALIASVDGAALLRQFQRTGPKDAGLAAEIASAIQQRVLGEMPDTKAPEATSGVSGALKRWFRRG